MKNYFNIEEIEKILTNDELLSGNFGLEKEGLRSAVIEAMDACVDAAKGM